MTTARYFAKAGAKAEKSPPGGGAVTTVVEKRHSRREMSVEDAATAMGIHRKTLVDRLRSAGLPSPRTIIGWSRLLTAARLLDDPGRTVEQVALRLDFPSGTALRNMFKRYTGLRTSEVRENGGVRCVLHAFKRVLAATAAGHHGRA
jgi:AraC-like DNA-binding protein